MIVSGEPWTHRGITNEQWNPSSAKQYCRPLSRGHKYAVTKIRARTVAM